MYIAEVYELKAVNLHRANNVFLEVQLGFNETQRGRVHNSAGAAAVCKELFPLNLDEQEIEDEKLYIKVMDQNVAGAGLIGRCVLNGGEIQALLNVGDIVEKKILSSGDREMGRMKLSINRIDEEEYEFHDDRSSWFAWRRA